MFHPTNDVPERGSVRRLQVDSGEFEGFKLCELLEDGAELIGEQSRVVNVTGQGQASELICPDHDKVLKGPVGTVMGISFGVPRRYVNVDGGKVGKCGEDLGSKSVSRAGLVAIFVLQVFRVYVCELFVFVY